MIQASTKSIPLKKTEMYTDRKAICMPWLASLTPSSSFVLLKSTHGYLQAAVWKAAAAVSRSLPMAEDQPGYCSNHISLPLTPEYLEDLYPHEIL